MNNTFYAYTSRMSISKVVDALRLEKNCVDLGSSRRSQLDGLAQCLTLSEIHYLRKQLEKHSAKNGNIFLEQLPPEISQNMANYFHLDDMLRIRAVSRSWRRIFSSTEFCLYVIRMHFQVAWERHLKYYKPSSLINKSDQTPSMWLQYALVERIRRERGLAPTVRHKLKLHQPHLPVQYCNGRMAFHNSGIFEVEDLYTRSRSILTTTNRKTMHKWLLSDHLLIGMMCGPAELCAWKLSVEDESLHRVRLPCYVHSLTAHKNEVGIITTAYEVILWTVGGPLQALKTLSLDEMCAEQTIMAADIFFHFNEQNRCFLAYHIKIASGSEKEYITRIVVESFVSRKLVRTQHINVSNFNLPHKHQSSLISNDGIIGIEVHDHPQIGFGDDKFQILTYDMRSGHFNSQRIQLHPTQNANLKTCNYLIWRDQIYQPISCRSSELTSTLKVITISKSLVDIWDPNNKKDHELSHLLRGENRQSSTCQISTRDVKPLQKRRIWGDDDFIVLFTGVEFIIWKFAKSTRFCFDLNR